jgi:hypothetical protein
MKQTEHLHQVALINWARLNTKKYPELDLLFSIPNGGKRHIGVAKKLKAEGVKPGIPDLFLPVARGNYHGMFIEMKADKGRLSPAQKQLHNDLGLQGYKVETYWDWQDAAEGIIQYLGL